MSQPRPTIYLPSLLGCLLAISAVGCQSFGPNGYGGYPSNYGYPAYQPGTVVPYNGPQGTIVTPGNAGFGQQPGMYPQQQGLQGAYPPGAAPPFNPGYNPNYSLPPVNPNPGFGANPQTGVQGADTDGDNFGQPGQFPGAGASAPSSQRPRIPADDKMPSVPDYKDVTDQPDTASPAVDNVNRRTGPRNVDLGPESFKGEINGGKRATQKLPGIEDDGPEPTSQIPKKTSMILNDADGSTIDFVPPINTELSQQGPRNIIQTAQHQERFPVTVQPYGRASNGQAWFRGVVDFDEQEKTWYLIYNPQPDETDKRGGIIALLEHPLLQFLTSDDTVLIEGRFDPQTTDRYGHAKYRIDTVKRLVVPQAAGI